VDWFSQNVFADLQAESSAVHPILQVDAIKYLYTFRNQVRWPIANCQSKANPYSRPLTAHEGSAAIRSSVAGSAPESRQLRHILFRCHHYRESPLHQAERIDAVSRHPAANFRLMPKRSFPMIQFQPSRRQAVCREHLNGLLCPDPTGRYTAEDRRERPFDEVYVVTQSRGCDLQRLED
jgi:hypothetical protein